MTPANRNRNTTPSAFFAAAVAVVAMAAFPACSGEKAEEPAEQTPAAESSRADTAEANRNADEAGDPEAQKKILAEAFADLYRDNMKTLEPRIESEFEHAEEMVLAMGILDPASPQGAKDLEERLAQAGLGMDQARELLAQDGMGRLLTEAVSEVKKGELATLYEKMSAKDLPSLSGTKEGCQALPAMLEEARKACVAPNSLARLHMGIFDCKSRKEAPDPLPTLPQRDEYQAACLESGALWPLLMKSK